ncbi:protein kinase [Prosthecobacter sp.]|uniref:protein kinase domain-containing protein n=1 Tax=Prosthecobacter sp. TaxID=1965333 RepID=UPI002ABB1509|nr:protein kinase [Prosthecobacter sp.]MDZ4404007.1 protein kinase [Prosthecobacter sp.]
MNERYELLAPIAEGGLGTVFRARDKQLGREVAVKRIRADKAGDFGSAVDALIREARQQSVLQHPNIVTVHDAGVDDEGGFIVMELVKGETLEDIIMRGALTAEDFDSLVRQTLDGMIAAHEQGIIHLDLKPGNLMITWLPGGRFQVKILDFGLAKTAKQPVQQDTDSQGGLLGSVHFMAPEQFERADVDTRTDIYALGCVFYYALTQKYPFTGDTMPQVMVAHLYHRTKPLAALRPDLPAHTVQWVEWLINRVPANRPASVTEALQVYDEGGFKKAVPVAVATDEPAKVRRKVMTGPVETTGGKKLVTSTASGTSSSRLVTSTGTSATSLPSLPSRPAKAPFPKWAAVTIPFLVIVIGGFAVKRFIERSREAGRLQRFAEIASADKPQVSDLDMRLLFDYLENPKTTAAAAQALSQVEGGDYIDSMLVQHLGAARHPMARANLVKVIGLREIGGTFGPILPLVRDADSNVRRAAWTALGLVTQGDDLAKLLEQLHNVPEKEADFAEQAAVSAIQAQSDRNAAVVPVIAAYRNGNGGDSDRALLLRILGRVGGGESLAVILEAIADPVVSVRKAALIAMAQWPACDPLPSLTARLPREIDPACRLLLLTAATQLCTQTGTLPQAELFAQAKRLYEASKDAREKDQALAALSRITDPDAAAFFDVLAVSEPQRKAQATAISKAINTTLTKVATITGTTTVSADKADYPKLGGMDLMADILVNWLDEGDWAAWFLKFEQPGKYEIAVRQASASQKEGVYEVVIAGQTLRTSVVRTGSAQEFKSCIVGEVEIKQAGIHRLRINAVEIPEREQLFRVKALELVKK